MSGAILAESATADTAVCSRAAKRARMWVAARQVVYTHPAFPESRVYRLCENVPELRTARRFVDGGLVVDLLAFNRWIESQPQECVA